MYSRRQVLAASGAFGLSGLAGCSARYAFRPKVDFAVENYLGESTQIDVAFLYPDESERSEAIAYQNSFEIPPQTELDETWSEDDVVTDRPYRIELVVGSTDVSHHYHYLPDCLDEDPYDIGVLATLLADGVRFSQTTCSDDSILL